MSSQGAKSGRSLLVAFLGFAAGATVANIYYSQPLLHAISTHFHSSAALTSIISVATQLGYGSGLLVFVPLGDSVERRTLIVGSIIGTALILLSTAFSATLPFLILVRYLLGLICITPQLIVPYAAGIAEPKARGRTVGIVMRPRDNTRSVVFRSGAREACRLWSKRSWRIPSSVRCDRFA
jgi:MFS family permease